MLLFNQKVINKSVIIVSFMLFSGCTTIKDPLGIYKITQLRVDAESIFRRQNIVVSEVMILTMDEENDTLSEAEQEMQDACMELNAYAVRVRDKTGDDLMAQQRVLNTLDACEAATSRLEVLVKSGAY
ncbi:MAG: hypothetical protein DRQ62_01620 [Gammaproteobacteria bacterium]|nr:MAG: hypothetical protein DRQ62_01620 [Gammaproteobacteria bacterium]